jgi:curved DNA-binding protein CbpA
MRMDESTNYYAILGVLPSAEPVVIRAAYRALALRYHPDTWVGDPAHAERKMRELNEAYEVLSQEAGRSDYDMRRQKRGFEEYEYENDQTKAAFKNAEDAHSADWSVALEYFPDLSELDSKLRATSIRLAFAFRATILETKSFEQRREVATELERQFLQTYFGTNPKILEFARNLIARGKKPAAKELNRAVAVLGDNVDPALLMNRIREKYLGEEEAAAEIGSLAAKLVNWRHVSDAIALVKKLNGSVQYGKERGWLGGKKDITVRCQGKARTFANEPDMVDWVIYAIAANIEEAVR